MGEHYEQWGLLSGAWSQFFSKGPFLLREKTFKPQKSVKKPRKLQLKTCLKPLHAFLKPFEALYAQTFNSRDFNSREHFWFFGHNSAPWRRRGTGIGGHESYRPPGTF